MKFIRTIWHIVEGWAYLIAFITGGNFIRRAQLKSMGRGVKISPTAFFKYPQNIELGEGAFINHVCSVWASPQGSITIGKHVLLGPNVAIISSNHGIAAGMLIRDQPGEDAPIEIGDDCWIGANAVITPGVTIGTGAVVGAGAVVTKNLPPMCVCAGVPARVIGYRCVSGLAIAGDDGQNRHS